MIKTEIESSVEQMAPNSSAQVDLLSGTIGDFLQDLSGQDLLNRLEPLHVWWNKRLEQSLDPYCKFTEGPILTHVKAYDRALREYQGVNFASQDYLSLASHKAIKAAAINAVQHSGVHSAGSAVLMGLTQSTLELETMLADWLGYSEATVFPTGWAAGYGAIKALVQPSDFVVVDSLAHACLQEGARSATRNVKAFHHLSISSLTRRLRSIRNEHPNAGILVVTESLFSMDSDTPDLKVSLAVCREYGATLMVDCAHDLGCMGQDGKGFLSEQGVLGDVDIVMGSFSKTFASNGGFVAGNHPALKSALRFGANPYTFSNALSPVQAEIVKQAIRIVRSTEGSARREALMKNVMYLRQQLSSQEFAVLGNPSPIVPIVLGNTPMSRLMTRHVMQSGALVNLVEFPAVSRNSSRYRLQVMADHQSAHIDQLVKAMVHARFQAHSALNGSGITSSLGVATTYEPEG